VHSLDFKVYSNILQAFPWMLPNTPCKVCEPCVAACVADEKFTFQFSLRTCCNAISFEVRHRTTLCRHKPPRFVWADILLTPVTQILNSCASCKSRSNRTVVKQGQTFASAAVTQSENR